MAKGDIITGQSGANAAITYTPAAGVEVMITGFSFTSAVNDPALFASDTGYCIYYGAGTSATGKWGVTSSSGVYIGAQGASKKSAYTGVQTK